MGIKPENYQAYIQGKMTLDEASGGKANNTGSFLTGNAQKVAPVSTSSYSKSSSSGSSGSSSSYSSAPAITAAGTNNSTVGLPSWMGNQYQQVPGTNWYSTNPNNRNAAKYTVDGTPVPTIGFGDQATGIKFDGYGTPEQSRQLQQLAGTPNSGEAISNLLKSWINSGELISNDSIYGQSGGYASQPAITAAATATKQPMVYGTLTPTNQKYSADQLSAQAWINNAASGQGGMDNYVKTQQAKYDKAKASGDQNMLDALEKDMNRVGYTLNKANNGSTVINPPSLVGNPNEKVKTENLPGDPNNNQELINYGGINNNVNGTPVLDVNDELTKKITANIMNGINQQALAINQGLATSQQANQQAVTENNNYLNEQIGKLSRQKAQDLENAVAFQNRRGGFYSGGLDYQQGQINNGYNESQNTLQRDVASRNNSIWSNNALLAQQAAQKIAQLQQQAPDQIIQAIDAAVAKQQEAQAKDSQQKFDNAVKESDKTGYFLNPQIAAIQQKMAKNSQDWFTASPEEKARLAAENQQLASQIGIMQNAQGDWQYTQGTPTLDREKQTYNQEKDAYDRAYTAARDQIKDIQWQATFDKDERRWGLEFAVDKAYKNGQLSIQERNTAIAAAREAWAQDPNNPDNLYKMAQANKATTDSGTSKIDPKDSADNYNVIIGDLGTDGLTKDKAIQLVQANRNYLTDSDYKKLFDEIEKRF